MATKYIYISECVTDGADVCERLYLYQDERLMVLMTGDAESFTSSMISFEDVQSQSWFWEPYESTEALLENANLSAEFRSLVMRLFL